MKTSCPRCGRHIGGEPALSRADNATRICSPCGTEEALDEWIGQAPIAPEGWPVAG